MERILYHGTNNINDVLLDKTTYFSSSKDFSKDYGMVNQYKVTLNNPFNSSLKEDIDVLLNVVGELVDGYSGDKFSSFEEFESSGLIGCDTWEVFEPFISQIEQLGYDGMIIFEGGVENFVTFNASQIVLV